MSKLKREIAVEDGRSDELAEAIMRSARPGKIGDGKILIFDLSSPLRIRTGEEGSQAL